MFNLAQNVKLVAQVYSVLNVTIAICLYKIIAMYAHIVMQYAYKINATNGHIQIQLSS